MTFVSDFTAINQAAERIANHIVTTPLFENTLLNQAVGGRVMIKAECLQHAGAFKYRGAINHILQLTEEERASGVLAWSSGNHAQGVAAAAQREGIKATIVMPKDAPSIKIDNTRNYGAEVVFYDRYNESREAIGSALAEELGATIIAPYDNPHVISGQGTVGLELLQQLNGERLDNVLMPCGGGGLCAGSAMAMRSLQADLNFFAVEPEDFDDTRRSLAQGERLSNGTGSSSICDALLTPTPGELTFPINQHYLSGALTVSDDEVREAIRFAWKNLKLVVEPGGAVALAAVLSGKVDGRDKTTALVLSGGNIDPALYCEIIANTP
jgi:threonine dehydratase